MTDTPYSFTVGDATITPIPRVTNRARAKFRRVHALVFETSASSTLAYEFSYLVAYSASVVWAKDAAEKWTPPSPDAPDEVLLVAFEAWQDFDVAYTDPWLEGLFPAKVDPVTDPNAPPDTADPNSLSADTLSKTA